MNTKKYLALLAILTISVACGKKEPEEIVIQGDNTQNVTVEGDVINVVENGNLEKQSMKSIFTPESSQEVVHEYTHLSASWEKSGTMNAEELDDIAKIVRNTLEDSKQLTSTDHANYILELIEEAKETPDSVELFGEISVALYAELAPLHHEVNTVTKEFIELFNANLDQIATTLSEDVLQNVVNLNAQVYNTALPESLQKVLAPFTPEVQEFIEKELDAGLQEGQKELQQAQKDAQEVIDQAQKELQEAQEKIPAEVNISGEIPDEILELFKEMNVPIEE